MLDKTQLLKLMLIGFIAGFLATILFHQGFLELLFQMGVIPKKPFSMVPTYPFGIPSFISLAFWGGVWGILGVLLFKKFIAQKRFWLFFTLFGGIFPPLLAVLVVFPLKHINPNIILHPAGITLMFMVNAIWGLGTAFIIKLFLFKRI